MLERSLVGFENSWAESNELAKLDCGKATAKTKKLNFNENCINSSHLQAILLEKDSSVDFTW